MKRLINYNAEYNPNLEKIEKLKGLYPELFDTENNFDFKKFSEYMTEIGVNEFKGYSLEWLGKNYSKLLSGLKPLKLLSKESEFNTSEGNVYIKGDNLEALKILSNSYANSIKMIYIDPPYNTGDDGFTYSDNYKLSIKEIEEYLDVDTLEAERILEFTNRASNSHSAWLSFMYPRLFIARDLLKKDGIIFISIDDNEFAQLKLLCDEIFGEENFVTNFIWQNKKGGGNDATHVAVEHEYIVMYAKKKTELPPLFEDYKESYLKRYDQEDEIGKYYWDTFARSKGKAYPIETPDGTILEFHKNGEKIKWLRVENTFKKDLQNDEVKFDKNPQGEWNVYFKQRLPKGKKPRSLYFKNTLLKEQGTTSDGTSEIKDLFDNKSVFSNPKPVNLIKYLIEIIFNGEEDGIVLDFFGGSSTTANAVIEFNVEKKRNVNFILVQLDEAINEKKNPEAIEYCEKYGLEKLITTIGLTRINKVIEKYSNEDADGQLSFLENDINYSLKFDVYSLKDIKESTIDKMLEFKGELISNDEILNELNLEDLLITWLVEDGNKLNSQIEEIDLNGYQAFKVNKSLYLLNSGFIVDKHLNKLITLIENEAEFILNKIVVLEYSFSSETLLSLKENVKHLINGRKVADIHLEVRY